MSEIKFKQEPLQALPPQSLPPKVGTLPKPLVERRRRARINASVDALRDMLPVSGADSRTDKADVLELAVTHLKTLRKRRREARDKRARNAQVAGLEHIRTEEKSFRTGYSECLSEVAKMLMFSPAIDEMTRNKLVSRLSSVSNCPIVAPRVGAASPVSCGATPPHSPQYPSPPSSPARETGPVKVCGSPPASAHVRSPGRVPGLIKPKPQFTSKSAAGFPKVLTPAIQAALQARLNTLVPQYNVDKVPQHGGNPYHRPALPRFLPKPGTITTREDIIAMMSQPLSERTKLSAPAFSALPLWRPW